ncbi:TonB family protein [Algiphilus sp. W345]|uniref:TonB family protein n=1 Tax=Banduia mediterranea TaxID=3075609 RepID=A0ABU2WFQ0_9GAMM|nr:TonB family protein [Algiphilus sp. W345]MDT0496703.1 TonB family protein [Algiphilus sp. W345]
MSRIVAFLGLAGRGYVPLWLALLSCTACAYAHAAGAAECESPRNSRQVRTAVEDARSAIAEGRAASAIESLLAQAATTRKDADRATLLLTAGYLQLRGRQLDEASDTLAAAMQAASPDSATRRSVRELMAQALWEQKRYQQIIELYESTNVCVLESPWTASYSYGAALLKTGQLDRVYELAAAVIGPMRESMNLRDDEPLYDGFEWQVLGMSAQCALQKRRPCLESWRDLYRIRDMSETISPALSFMLPRIKDWPEAQAILPGTITLDAGVANDGDWVPAAIMRDAVPAYPTSAIRNGQEGWVLLRIEFDRDGNVSDAEVLKSRPERVFDAAALSAAKRIVMMPSPDIPAGETRATRKLYQFRIAR